MLRFKKLKGKYLMIFALAIITVFYPAMESKAADLKDHSVITIKKDEEIPSEIIVKEKSNLSINKDKYRDNEASLEWKFNEGDQLRVESPIGYKDKDNHTFSIWIYNNDPVDENLLFEFKEDGETKSEFEFNMNFTGWRTAWVPFVDMKGEPSLGMDELVITSPQEHSGKILLDQMVLSVPMDTRHPTPDKQVPFVNPGVDDLASAHWQSLLLYDNWLDDHLVKGEPSKEELEGIKTIEKRYIDFIVGNGVKLTDEMMEKYRETFKDYEIKRLADGSITGRPVNLVHLKDIYPPATRGDMETMVNPINVRDYTDLLLDISKAYISLEDDHAYKAELKTIYVNLIDHMIDQGWAAGSSLGTVHHLGYNMRGLYPSTVLMKDELKEAGLLDDIQESMKWFTGMGRFYEIEVKDESYANIDILNTTLQGMVGVILTIDDETEQVALFNQLSKWLDDGLLPAPGLMPSLKEDGSGFHHMGFYPAYARGAYNSMSPVVHFISRTPFKVSQKAHETLKKAVLSMRLYSNTHNWLLSVSGRHPTGEEGLTSYAYEYLAMAGSPDGREEIDSDMAAAYLRLVELNRDNERTDYIRSKGHKPEKDPNGNWTMNYGALSMHRRDDWLVGVKGHNRYVWAGELYTGANWYGRYTSYGQIEVMGGENNLDSGFSHDGWDWNRWPGTTTINLPLDDLKASSFTEMLLNDETFAGGLNIEEENGMFGMKLREHPKYNYSHKARKSVFMFDDRVIALGSDIENDDSEHNTETTLFQNHMKTDREPMYISDGVKSEEISQLPFKDSMESNDTSWLIDNKGHGYYVPGDQSIKFSRSLQKSKDQANGKDTEGTFSTAWLDHGKAPKGESYEFAILVNAKTRDKMAEFAKKMNSDDAPYTVKKKDKDAHIVYDKATKTTGYALFKKDLNLEDERVVSSDKPVMVMVKDKEDGGLVLSTVDPDLRLYEGLDEEQYDEDGNFVRAGVYSRPWRTNESIMRSSRVTVKGLWDLKETGDNYRVAGYDKGNTILEFDNQHAMPIEVQLVEKMGK